MYTLQMNRIGHIHIWHSSDNSVPKRISKYNYTLSGRESDIYLQCDTDILSLLDSLSEDHKWLLDHGWPIVNESLELGY